MTTSTELATVTPLPAGIGGLDRPSTFEILPMAVQLAQHVHATEFVPAALRNSPEKVCAAVLRGHELGLDPMYSLNAVYVIQGRAGLYAETLRALILRAGHELWTEEANTTRVTICAQRRGSARTLKVTYTMDDAQKAGLVAKENWRKAPGDMLFARASARMARWHFPEVMLGLPAVEEIEDGFDFDADAGATGTSATTGATTTRKARKAATKKAATQPRPDAIDAAASDGPPPPPLPGEDAVAPQAESSPGTDDVEEHDGDVEQAVDPNVVERAKRIAMQARELDLDRADVIYVVTNGRKTSGKDLTKEESTAVLETLRRIKVRELALDTSGPEPELIETPQAEPDEDETSSGGEPHEWDGDRWRTEIKARGLKAVKVIERARELAKEIGESEPLAIDELHRSSPSLCAVLLGWMEEQAEGAAQ